MLAQVSLAEVAIVAVIEVLVLAAVGVAAWALLIGPRLRTVGAIYSKLVAVETMSSQSIEHGRRMNEWAASVNYSLSELHDRLIEMSTPVAPTVELTVEPVEAATEPVEATAAPVRKRAAKKVPAAKRGAAKRPAAKKAAPTTRASRSTPARPMK